MSDSNNKTISVKLISNSGAGDKQVVEVTESMTVGEFIAKHISGGDQKLIRLNGAPVGDAPGQVSPNTPLQDNARISESPKKVEGATL